MRGASSTASADRRRRRLQQGGAPRHQADAAGGAVPRFHVINGDINRPAQLASDLEASASTSTSSCTSVRSSITTGPTCLCELHPRLASPRRRARSRTWGTKFADELEENLVRHLRRWAPYIGRFGLLVLELHTLPAALPPQPR